VVSLYQSELTYADGHRTTLRYNVCSHFDATKHIDRLECFQSPLMATISWRPLHGDHFSVIQP
jgi:hypothetical protein